MPEFDTPFIPRGVSGSQMTQEKVETNDNGLVPLVGLARHAYNGAPRGVAQVSLSNPELRVKKLNWALKTKQQRRQEIIDTL